MATRGGVEEDTEDRKVAAVVEAVVEEVVEAVVEGAGNTVNPKMEAEVVMIGVAVNTKEDVELEAEDEAGIEEVSEGKEVRVTEVEEVRVTEVVGETGADIAVDRARTRLTDAAVILRVSHCHN